MLMRRNGSWWYATASVAGLFGLAVALFVVGFTLTSFHDLERAASVAQIAGYVLSVVSVAVGIVRWWRRTSVPAVPPGTVEMARAKDVLAGLIAEQWAVEAAMRSLNDPDPIPIQWCSALRHPTVSALMDHRANIETGRADDGVWTACSSDIAALVDRFRGTRRRRLVILGEAGMGKTTLAVQLLLHLLDTRAPGEPVPVLLPAAAWNAARANLHDWLAEQIGRNYPALRSPQIGADVIRALAGRGHILAILDGFDELPPSARAEMITALNSTLSGDDELILTSRTAEYGGAVARANRVLTSAVVLTPIPLTPQAAADYLALWLPPSPGAGWQRVLAHLRATPPGGRAPSGPAYRNPRHALADVAATPLGLWLLRAAYSAPGADPAELTDPAWFPHPGAIRARLFDRLVPALVRARPPSDDPAEPFRPLHRHDPDKVRRYLGYLACTLHQTPPGNPQPGIGELAWWQLARRTLKPGTFRILLGLALGLIGWLWIWLIDAPAVGIATGRIIAFLAVGFQYGIVSGPVGAVLGVLVAASWQKEVPGTAGLSKRRISVRDLAKSAFVNGRVFGSACGSMFGLAAAIAITILGGPKKGAEDAILGGIIAAVVAWFVGAAVGGLQYLLEVPAPTDQASTPSSTWHADRFLNLGRTVTVGVAGGLIGVFGAWAAAQPAWAIFIWGAGIGLPIALTVGLVAGRHHAWPAYLVATYWLAGTNRLPRKLMPFLADMHRIGLLRAVGPIYQFRHIELQQHLAATYQRAHTPPTVPIHHHPAPPTAPPG